MKKIINEPSNFVEESIQGLIKSHPDVYAFAKDNKRVITRAKKASNKVGVVSGGGSGHLPVFTGYVGKGILDACAVGSVFASPSVDQIASAIRNGDNGNGVLCILGNYGGDVMNFEMACEIVASEGIKTKTIIVADDIASAKNEEKLKRRGIAGMIFVFKIAGAAAEANLSMDEVFKIATDANNNIRTLGVAVSPCTLPEAGKPTFELSNDEIEIGMGIHGEPGIKREKLRKADLLVDDLCKIILDDFKLSDKDKVTIMINSLGATPLEELYIVSKRVHENFSKLNIEIIKTYVGRYATSMEMAGMSITVLKLDDNLKKMLFSQNECPFWIN
ncbi:MAG: dihydroxyacetone kinase subunit DhaK [Candidatus Pelagibacterales bacterium]|nr:MAG: dihydroxyacetone kinase subunit DhaK [Pelagibacterales bacterium]|tara:strand:+ start:211 stop:1206 length:996 start_codon:yes stop_codon:yes gene_type:complete